MKNIHLRELVSSRVRCARFVATVFVAAVVMAIATTLSLPVQAAVGINKTMSFQGKVVNANGTNVADGNYLFRFRIYTSASADNVATCANSCMWEESKSLATVNGIFQTNLGDGTPLPGSVDFNSDTLYLSVLYNGDTEMTPRIRLAAVPYAFNATKLGGLDSSSFVQLSPGAQQSGFINISGVAIAGGNITTGGTFQGNALDTAAANAINIGTTNATSINIGKTASNSPINLNGPVLIKPAFGYDSYNAFQVQSSSGYGVFNVDSINGYVGVLTNGAAPNYPLDVRGDVGIAGNLHFVSGTTRIIDVATNSSGAGNVLSIKGGAAGSGNTNGGDLNLSGGTGAGTGAMGLVNLSPAVFTASATQSYSAPGAPTTFTLSQTLINSNNSVPVLATTTGVTVNVPDPTQKVAGRVLYVTASNGSSDFTLVLNSARTAIPIAMRQNSTATLIFNGTDWTAAGASSSTTLQAAYDNTLASAGGAEIVLNNTANSNGLTIRNALSNPIVGPVFEVQSSIGTELLAVNSNAKEFASNGGAETPDTFTSNWSNVGAGSTNRFTSTASYIATGQAAVQVNTPATANAGVRNIFTQNISNNPLYTVGNTAGITNTPTTFQVSFTGMLDNNSPVFDASTNKMLEVIYSPDGGGTTTQTCSSYSTQVLVKGTWSKITCTFTDTASATSSVLIIRQTDAAARTFYIDNLSVTQNDQWSTPANLQVGGGSYGGNVTLFTLDRSSSPPVATGNQTLFGSMYYDITSGRIQCYQSNGWGACGSAPDTYVNLSPEYPNAVLNGTGVGTMTADFCSNQSGILQVNTLLCGSGQAFNFYRWTSPQPASPSTLQVYSIYLSYQLPGGFKKFQSNDTVQLTARVDDTTNAQVTYQMYKNQGGSLTACGSETTVTTQANLWQPVGINGNEADAFNATTSPLGCSFDTSSANNYVVFKINLKARANATAYVSSLSFTITNQ